MTLPLVTLPIPKPTPSGPLCILLKLSPGPTRAPRLVIGSCLGGLGLARVLVSERYAQETTASIQMLWAMSAGHSVAFEERQVAQQSHPSFSRMAD